MFDLIDMTKTMYFSDGSSLDFQSAQRKLAEEIGLSRFSETKDIETKIFSAIKNYTIQSASGTAINEEDQKVVAGFYRWVQSIHNDKLIPPSGTRFSNNIVYDMLAKLRSKSDLTPEQTLLRFFLEGANGRKISKGNTPSIDFIATSLVLDAINAAEKLGAVSSKQQQFKKEYESIIHYIEPQRKLESAATEIKNNPVYGFLFDQKIFEFEKEKNETTGANRYLTNKAIEKGTKVLGEHTEKLDTDIAQMVSSISSIMKEITPAFTAAQKNATEIADLLGKWDASEWAARFYTALSIAAHYDSKHQTVLDEFRANPFFGDILSRNEKGDYPANARNKEIENLDIVQLFTQAKLSEQAVSPTSYHVPKDSPIASNSSSVYSNQVQAKNLKVKGEVVLLETPGRKDPWVKQKVEKDYFLALKITAVDGQQITTTRDFHEKVKSSFPETYAGGQKLDIQFQNVTLPPGAEDMPHISLGNFPDFRFDRDVAKGVDTNKVAKAENVTHRELEFEITPENFELAIATKEQAEKNYIESSVAINKETPRKAVVTTTVGMGRDAVLTLKPTADTQTKLANISKEVFGSDFVLWNSEKKPLDYHITVGQSNEFIKTIKPIMQQSQLLQIPGNTNNDVNKTQSMSPTYY